MGEINSASHIGFRSTDTRLDVPFGIPQEDRMRHAHIMGESGSGKSTLLKQLVLEDVYAGRGVGVIDPHGDLAEELLDLIPPERFDDVCYFNVRDTENPMPLNVLTSAPAGRERDKLADEVVGSFRYIWGDLWGAGRMQYIMKATIAALLDYPNDREGVTLLGVPRMYSDRAYRNNILQYVRNQTVRDFWEDEFPNYAKRYGAEALDAIRNKTNQFFMSDVLRNHVGQARNSVSFRHVMDKRRIFIANLDGGAIGEDNSRILGGLLITALYLASKRSDLEREDRVPFSLYIDEVHDFTTQALASILSGARKSALALTVAHQYLEQLHEDVVPAIRNTSGNRILFRTGADDAGLLARSFDVRPQQLTDLDNGWVYARVLQEGSPHVYLGQIRPTDYPRIGGRESLKKYSQQRFTRPRWDVENRIVKWYGMYEKENPRPKSGGGVARALR